MVIINRQNIGLGMFAVQIENTRRQSCSISLGDYCYKRVSEGTKQVEF